jgi:hypothetical protein
MKTLTITIGTDAAVAIETAGFVGAECLKSTKAIEDGLGTVTDRKKKPEYFQAKTGAATVVNRGG